MPAAPGSISVLHVDDEPAVAELVSAFLEREDERFEVHTATGAEGALERLAQHEYDCVVSDYDMPGLDGIAFLRAVRQTHPDIPFILYTGKGSEEVASEAISAGVTDYLQKEAGTSQYRLLANRITNAVEQRQARIDAQETEQRLRTIAENTDEVLWMFTDDWDELLFVNSAYEAIWGRPISDLREDPSDFLSGIHPDDRSLTRDAMARLSAGESVDIEYRVNEAEDFSRWVWVRGEPVTDSNGDVEKVVGFARDVTRRKTNERELEGIVHRLQDILQADSKSEVGSIAIEVIDEVIDAPLAGVHLQSEAGDVLDAVASLDRAREELGIRPSYSRDTDDFVDEVVWEVFEDGRAQYFEDTREVDGLADVTPARSAFLTPLGPHGVLIVSSTEPNAFDGTDRHFIELLAGALTAALDQVDRETALRIRTRQLEELHETTRELLQTRSPEAVAEQVVDAAESILDFPITLVRYYDEEANGLVPISASDAIYEVFEERTVFTPDQGSLNWEVYKSGSPAIYDDVSDIDRAADSDTPLRSLMVLPIGEYGTLSVGSTAATEFGQEDEHLAKLLVLTAELALSRLEYERELVEQRDELDEHNERLSQFASIVSHDLRNPLSVAMGRLELAEAEVESEHLDAIGRALERMEDLIQDMLTLSRGEHTDVELETIDLAALVQSCEPNVDAESISVEVETSATIVADESRLRQLFENLIRNAAEHGEGMTTVRVGDLASGFYVEDDGPGVPPDRREEVFEAGYSTNPEGTGLGLKIVDDITTRLGWDVELTESSTGGARFEFTGVELVD